ncbi:hypothetical protein [Ekhidna sp.]
MIKAVKVLNAVSVFLFTVILLVIYAYLPIMVDLSLEGVKGMHKQTFFYYAFGGFVTVNIILRIGINLGSRNLSTDLTAWIRTIIFIVNFYLTTLIGFLGVLNNASSIDPSNYAYLNYLGPIFLVFWIIGLFFFILQKK